jgi:serine phosphatase RsbU (regulator of sigma subunit)
MQELHLGGDTYPAMAAVAEGRLQRALERLTDAAGEVARGADLPVALQAIADAAAAATGAELAVVRVLDPLDGQMAAAGVAAGSRARAAEVQGTRFPAAELEAVEVSELDRLPGVVRRIAERSSAGAVLQLPVAMDNGPAASLELFWAAAGGGSSAAPVARLAAAHVGLCLRAAGGSASEARRSHADVLELAGEALAAASADEVDFDRLARLALESCGADAVLLWRGDDEGPLELAASAGGDFVGGDGNRRLAEAGLQAADGLVVETDEALLPGGYGLSAVVPMGRPAVGALQLLFTRSNGPSETHLAPLTGFGAQAGRAVRSAERSRALNVELERSRALLGVLGRATAELSLAHTLAIALERIAALLGVSRVAVYLREGEGLEAAAEQGLEGPHVEVAERLLELALGPGRRNGSVVIENARLDRSLDPVREAAEQTGVTGALAAPLVANEEVIGLLAAYPDEVRGPDEYELGLLGALAGYLAVAVQNARLYEQSKELGERLEHALAAESVERRRLHGLYEVSRSFTQSLSLDETVEALTRAAIESLGVGAAVLRIPDDRGDSLVTQSVSVRDPRLEGPLNSMLSRAQVISRPRLQRFFRRGQPLRLDVGVARALGGSFELLVPFLERGSTVVVLPVGTPDEIMATLTLISLDVTEPIDDETVAAGLSLAGQAALAIDNARLYEQQKQFADSMQRSLLPRGRPKVPGLDLGVVYESSARMDVGGDLYDFLVLDDGKLALVLGDVTGHGVDAAADMAMAKFVFRSLAREHPGPADFLTHANDIVAEEIAPGKFITLLYLILDPARGVVAGAAAGHPPPRIVQAAGRVAELAVAGVALGIDPGRAYEESEAALATGDSVVLYTDGVVESRNAGELYGTARLDSFLAENRELSAQALAEAVVEESRRFAGGVLTDDCAVVVLRRTG